MGSCLEAPRLGGAFRVISRSWGQIFFLPSHLAAQVTFPGKPLLPSCHSRRGSVKEYFAAWHVYINSSLLFPPPTSSFRHSSNGFETTGAGFSSCSIL